MRSCHLRIEIVLLLVQFRSFHFFFLSSCCGTPSLLNDNLGLKSSRGMLSLHSLKTSFLYCLVTSFDSSLTLLPFC